MALKPLLEDPVLYLRSPYSSCVLQTTSFKTILKKKSKKRERERAKSETKTKQKQKDGLKRKVIISYTQEAGAQRPGHS